MRIDRALAAIAVFSLAACSGRMALPSTTAGTTAVESVSVPASGDGLIVHPSQTASLDARLGVGAGGADFTGYVRRPLQPGALPFGTRARSISKLELDSQVYPSYASVGVVTNKVLVPAPKGAPSSVTMHFSSLPVGNNEFVDVTIYGVGTDGSKDYLGDLAGFANVTPKSNSLTLTTASTLAFQAGYALIQDGLVTAQDLASTPAYAAEVGKRIAADHLKPSKATGLFTSQTLARFLMLETPRHRRTLTLSASPGASVLSIVNDVTDLRENTLAANEVGFPVTVDVQLSRPPGSPCYGYARTKIPPAKNRPAYAYCAWVFPVQSAPLVLPVYGGPLVVGDGNATPPYTGTQQRLKERAPGGASLQLGALKPAQTTLKMNDPFNWAFNSFAPLSGAPHQDDFPEMETMDNPSVGGWYFYAYNQPLQWVVPNGYWTAPHPPLQIDTWNPWAVPASTFQFCTQWSACQTIGSSAPLSPRPPFWDPGTNLAYYNWQASGGSAIAGPGVGCFGYNISLSSDTATMTTTVSSWMYAGQSLIFYFDTPCGSTPTGTIAVTVTASDGSRYISSAQVGSGDTKVTMSSMLFPVTRVKSITFTIETQVATSNLELQGIGNDYQEPSVEI